MFREWVEQVSTERRSNLVLALDLRLRDGGKLRAESLRLLGELSASICAVKFNRHITLPLGLSDGTAELVGYAHSLGLPVIMDCKLNDIGETNLVIAEHFFEAGFDALTVSPYVGWEGGLAPIFTLAHGQGKGMIPVLYMSHPGAREFYERMIVEAETDVRKAQYRLFAEKALEWDADGAVVGATRPDKVREVREILGGRVPIYSPGVGAQGGDAQVAMESGARYLIVGRAILDSPNAGEAAESLRRATYRSVGGEGS